MAPDPRRSLKPHPSRQLRHNSPELTAEVRQPKSWLLKSRATQTLQLCDISASSTHHDRSCCRRRQRIAHSHDACALGLHKQSAKWPNIMLIKQFGSPVSAAGTASRGGPRPGGKSDMCNCCDAMVWQQCKSIADRQSEAWPWQMQPCPSCDTETSSRLLR